MIVNKWIKIGIITIMSLVLIIIGTYVVVVLNAMGRTFDNVADVPAHEYGLLLGTSPITPVGARNFYFDNRIKAAVELYEAGKIKHIIASGGDYWLDENGEPRKNGCNELRSMRDSLVKYGVPWNAISLDYDGTRTLNSIVKAKDLYGLDSCIIISQQYHNERAIWQADHFGLKAVGYNAAPSHIHRNRIKNQAREFLARVKLMLDMLFGGKTTFDTYVVSTPSGHLEDWYDKPDSIPGMEHSIGHYSNADSSWGYYKYFSTVDGKPVYYNSRHGYYVSLPEGMGYFQSGEHMMGAHGNGFYNADTTLVVSAHALFNDVVLLDNPLYEDTLRMEHIQRLNNMGAVDMIKNTPEIIISRVRINHSNPDNPPADIMLNKFVLKRDIDNRECEMSLTIYFPDSLIYREPEFEKIINQFPDLPFIK